MGGTLMNLTDKAYVISLKKYPERLKATQQRLEFAGFTNVIPYVVTTPTYKEFVKYCLERRQPSWASKSTLRHPGALGCLQSHKELLLKIKQDAQPAFIFEDDILIYKRFRELFPTMQKDVVGRGWVYLGATQFNWQRIRRTRPTYRAFGSFGTFAYWVSHKVVDTLLKDIDTWRVPIDTYYASWVQKNLLGARVCYPYLMIADIQKPSETGNKPHKLKGPKGTRGWIPKRYL